MRVSGLAVTISVRFSIDEVTVQPHFRFANKSTRGHNSPISRRIHGHALPGKATVEYRPFNIPVEFAFLDSGIARPGLRGRAFLLASLESSQKPPSSPSPVLILLRGSKGEGQRWAACVPPPRTCMRVFRHSVGPRPPPRYHPRDNCTRQDLVDVAVTEFPSRSLFWDYINTPRIPITYYVHRLRFLRDDIFRGHRF